MVGPSLRFVAVFSCLTGLIFWIGNQFHGVVPFVLSAVFAGGAGLMLAFLVGLRKETRMELLSLAGQLGRTIGFAPSRGNSEPGASRPAFVAAAGAVSIDPSKGPAPGKNLN